MAGFSFRSGYVRAAGHRLYYEALGEGKRGSLLCLHGGPGATHDSIRPVTALAQFGYRIVLYDQFGCGRSQRSRSYEGLSILTLADEVDAVRRALRLGRCHLFGYSFGGALALQAVLRHPRGFRSLIVGSGFASMQQLQKEILRLVSLMPASDRDVILKCERQGQLNNRRYLQSLARFNRRHLSDLAITPIDLALTGRNFNAAVGKALYGPDDLTSRATGTMAAWDVRDQLRRIRVPTLITVGRRDSVTPRCARTLHRAIHGSRLKVFEKSGHDCLFKEQDRYLESVLGFLSGLDRN